MLDAFFPHLSIIQFFIACSVQSCTVSDRKLDSGEGSVVPRRGGTTWEQGYGKVWGEAMC